MTPNQPNPAPTSAAPAAPAGTCGTSDCGCGSQEKRFTKELTIGSAMRMHPRAAEVFMGFHLGGCSHCSISEEETIEQVSLGYGIPVDMLINALNSLYDYDKKRAEAAKAAQAKAAAQTAAGAPAAVAPAPKA
jgi:hybrid cluster-associated redox disulfide protein